MKKNLFILGIAALAFAACSNDEVVEVNQGEAISFRSLTTNVTRSTSGPMAGTSWADGDKINVYADYYDASETGHSKYFQADFTTTGGSNFVSAQKYYWPTFESGDKMTFTAIYGADQSTTTVGFIDDYSPAEGAASQMDVMVAKKEVTASVQPVLLNFRHTLSQIVVKVKNSNPNLDFDISGVRIGYVSTQGDFTYSGGVTDTQEATDDADAGGLTTDVTLVAAGDWTPAAVTDAATNKYDQTVSKTITSTVNDATALTSFNSWLLIPQTRTGFTAYTSGTQVLDPTNANPVVDGSYIALKLTIYNYNGSARSNKLVAEQWCYWPCSFTWAPGYIYTYTVDLAGGGYEPGNIDATPATTLDPVLNDNNVIVFSPSCTIDYWVNTDAQNVVMN